MSLFVTLAADILVAVLLAATIVTSLRLSRRIGQMKGDEAALRQTIGDLMVATGTAERAMKFSWIEVSSPIVIVVGYWLSSARMSARPAV